MIFNKYEIIVGFEKTCSNFFFYIVLITPVHLVKQPLVHSDEI